MALKTREDDLRRRYDILNGKVLDNFYFQDCQRAKIKYLLPKLPTWINHDQKLESLPTTDPRLLTHGDQFRLM